MGDYGHELTFGTFITPLAADPQATVELAVAAERAGLDLVTFQDHPYQPRFLDTWTLLSYVVARTERVTVSANVTNLPLRGPAIIARSVASLDRLTGGRVELGLGAGAFWDAIDAMGGRRLSPGEAVDELEEAVAIVRGIWDVDDRSRLHVTGRHHRVDGAKRGPAPAHDVEIWLGAYGPRLLGVVGRLADGWLPSEQNLRPGGLAAGNERIDDAARAAGREPSAVRRLLNLGPSVDVDRLVGLALEHGVSTFILGSDDAAAITRFGQEVAPEVRRAVDVARSSTSASR